LAIYWVSISMVDFGFLRGFDFDFGFSFFFIYFFLAIYHPFCFVCFVCFVLFCFVFLFFLIWVLLQSSNGLCSDEV
jgi:hypothetical protein